MQQHEQLSALMDGDLASTAPGFITDLESNPELRGAWARYHLIGAVLRDSGPAPDPGDLAARVREALAGEPALLAPRAALPERKPRALRPLAAAAMAASVAAVAVLALRGPEERALPVAEIAATPPVDAVARETPDTLQWEDAPVAVLDGQRAAALRELDRRLNGYLVNFNEQRSRLGIPGVNPYVRIVGFETPAGR